MSESVGGRFRVAADDLREGEVRIGAEEAHHMRVRRLRPGARIRLFDGSGREASARLERLEDDGAVARVERIESSDAESHLELVLVQGLPVKLPRVDDVVRQATELGVSRIVPAIAERSRLPGGGREALSRRVERWRRIAQNAAKQCGRGRLPQIDEPAPLADLGWDDWPRTRLLFDPEAERELSSAGLSEEGVTVLIGPEGGWSKPERELLVGAGASAVRFGPRALRSDSAGPAAMAVVQFLVGDLGLPSPRAPSGR